MKIEDYYIHSEHEKYFKGLRISEDICLGKISISLPDNKRFQISMINHSVKKLDNNKLERLIVMDMDWFVIILVPMIFLTIVFPLILTASSMLISFSYLLISSIGLLLVDKMIYNYYKKSNIIYSYTYENERDYNAEMIIIERCLQKHYNNINETKIIEQWP